jgi:trehalose 6-phosphate phosphatase
MQVSMDESLVLPPPPPLAEIDRSALFLDFDGTLVAIADTPDAIEVPADLAARLGSLATRMNGRLALISGRAVDDLGQHLGAMSFALAGSHGTERYGADGALIGDEPAPIPPDVNEALREFAEREGVMYERKPHGGALHFRAHPERMEAVNRFAEKLAREHGLSVKVGKQVTELVYPGVDKGGAVRAFMHNAEFTGATPVFIGDDLTDEDGFAAAADLGGFGVIVGNRRPTAARYQLASVAQVHQWLGL